jgi:hypothetical protein
MDRVSAPLGKFVVGGQKKLTELVTRMCLSKDAEAGRYLPCRPAASHVNLYLNVSFTASVLEGRPRSKCEADSFPYLTRTQDRICKPIIQTPMKAKLPLIYTICPYEVLRSHKLDKIVKTHFSLAALFAPNFLMKHKAVHDGVHAAIHMETWRRTMQGLLIDKID